MRTPIRLVVPNIAEFNLRHPAVQLDPATISSFQSYGRLMAEQSVFWTLEDRVLVLPAGLREDWFADVHDALGVDRPPVVSPRPATGNLTADLLADRDALAQLREHLDGSSTVHTLFWGAAESAYRLCDALRSYGYQVESDLPDESSYWTSLYLDSKLSCLDFAANIRNFRVAPSLTVTSWEELRGAVTSMTAGERSAIIRSAYGTSGEGSVVVGRTPGSEEAFWKAMRDDQLLRIFPLQVQEYLDLCPTFGSPAVDFHIDAGTDDDPVDRLVPSVMTVDGHRFVSVNLGARVLPPPLTGEVIDLSRAVASRASQLGFCGWFCIDFILDRHDVLHVTEFNARRSGGTQWIPLLDRYGLDDGAVAHAHHAIELPPEAPPTSYPDVRRAFHEMWSVGVPSFPISVDALASPKRRTYGVVTIGADTDEAERRCQQTREAVESTW